MTSIGFRRGKAGRSAPSVDPLDLLRAGKSVPKGLADRRAADIERQLVQAAKDRAAIRAEATKHFSQLRGGGVLPGASDGRALDRLRAITDRVARRKLVAPPPAQVVSPGLFPGAFSATITPPYDYDFAIPGNLPSRASSSPDGNISFHMATPATGFGFAFAHAEVGVYLRPTIGPALLRVSTKPAFIFSWSANSIAADSEAHTRGAGALTVSTPRDTSAHPLELVSRAAVSWDVRLTQQLDFDFGSSGGTALEVALEVQAGTLYILNVSCDGQVAGEGWPGSLATGTLELSVPFISFSLEPIPVATDGRLQNHPVGSQ
jgi:hypothetical protein